jgi:GT2 family glycosyltransferase
MASVTAIIPTWNRADLLRSILTNLDAQTRPPDQVIVVDNGSTDATQLVAREFRVDVAVFPENRGFAAAVNEGIGRAKGEWLLILNNDVVLEPEWLERLLASAEQENAQFAAGKLLRMDAQTLDGSWDLVSRAAYAWRCGFGRPDGAVWSVKRKISFVPMTAALFHHRVFEQIGLLETRFESYYEDVDFGVRCVLAGLEGIYEPAAVAMHMGKSTLGKGDRRVMFLSARNQVLLLAKHYPAETLRRFAWPIFVGQILAVLAAAKKGHLLAALRGKWDGFRQWSTFRSEVKPRTEIEAAFSESELEIRTLQKQIGFDLYWRFYFSLVRPG